LICFDHEEGSRLAIRHLTGRGHEGLGFVALHHEQSAESEFIWSHSRAEGFQREAARLSLRWRVFQPETVPPGFSVEDQEQAGFESSLKLLPHLANGSITGVICVNQYALQGLLHALHYSGVPESAWPTIMAFDDESQDAHLLSVVRLPWDEMGRSAAGALWKRAFGTPAERSAPPQDVLVPMQLVQRVAIADHFDTSRFNLAVFSAGGRSGLPVSSL
jgi:LacI family transcriptional regulator